MQWSETMHVRSQSDLQSGDIEERNKHASRGSHTTSSINISWPTQKKRVQEVLHKAYRTQGYGGVAAIVSLRSGFDRF